MTYAKYSTNPDSPSYWGKPYYCGQCGRGVSTEETKPVTEGKRQGTLIHVCCGKMVRLKPRWRKPA